MYNKNYLSKRPFMVITCKFRPGQGAQTQIAGWAERSGWNVVEEIAIVDRVSNKHMTYGTLIIDVLEAKVVKNGFQNTSKDEAMQHYMTKYKKELTEAIGVWMETNAHQKALEQIAAEDAAVTSEAPAATE